MLSHRQGAAWRQAGISLFAVVAVAAATWYCAVRPFDRDTLAIQAGQLQSQAAEAAMAARLLRADRIAPRFARIHARQLAGKTDDVASQLRAHPAGVVGGAYQESLVAADVLADGLRRSPPSRDAAREAAFAAWRARMDALRKRLKPEG